MSKSLKKLIDINRLRTFKNKLVGAGSPYVQTGAVDQTIAGTKTFSKPIVGSVTGSSGSCTGNAATATTATTAEACTGNAATATKLATARTINGTAFNGTANITTANWGTARNISIADATATNTGEAVSVNGSAAVTLKLPAAIKANVTGSLTGNAASATKLATARTIALSGAATGTATGFDGSGNITIPVTSLDASKLTGTASVSTTGNAATATTATTAEACTGNAASANIATKATQDAAGNTITTTYATKADASKTYVTKTDAAKTYATKSEIIVHAGVIIPFAGTSVPTGYLLCNGAAVSRTDYANLFAAIGTLYGAGDGSTTFNLPDARDRVLQGASGEHSVGSYIAAGLPNITGYVANGGGFYCYGNSGGAFSLEGAGGAYPNGGGASLQPTFKFDAHKYNALYGASSTVQSPAIATNFIIKY